MIALHIFCDSTAHILHRPDCGWKALTATSAITLYCEPASGVWPQSVVTAPLSLAYSVFNSIPLFPRYCQGTSGDYNIFFTFARSFTDKSPCFNGSKCLKALDKGEKLCYNISILPIIKKLNRKAVTKTVVSQGNGKRAGDGVSPVQSTVKWRSLPSCVPNGPCLSKFRRSPTVKRKHMNVCEMGG